MVRTIIGSLFLSLTALAPLSQGAWAQVQVVTSFSILGDLAEQIGGEAIAVTTIVGPDQDAHVYSPTAADARAVATADLLILNGLGFETWAADLVVGSGTRAPIVTVANNLPLVLHGPEDEATHEDHRDEDKRDDHEDHEDHDGHDEHDDHKADDHDEHKDHDDHDDHEDHKAHEENTFDAHAHAHDHGETDPHAWGAMANGIAYAAAIRDALVAFDPANGATYEGNFAAFEAEALTAKTTYAARIAALPADHRTVVTSHDAFGYFAEETGLAFLAVKGVNSASAASAGQVRDLIEQLRALPHAAIFVENIHNPALVQQIADETSFMLNEQALYSDALSAPDGPAATYLDWYSYNMETILTALESH